MIAIIAPMPSELRPLVRRLDLPRTSEQGGMPVHTGHVGANDVVVTMCGIGPDRAEATTLRLLTTLDPTLVLVCGIAGGVPDATDVGDLVVPAEVEDERTGDRFAATSLDGLSADGVIRTGDGLDYQLDAAAVEAQRQRGIVAFDMETAAVARVCGANDVPWAAIRVISDMAGDESIGPDVLTLVHPDGRPRVWGGIRYLLTHPHRIPELVRLGRDSGRAAERAAEETAQLLRALSLYET